MNILLGAQKVFIFPMIPGMMSVLQVLRCLMISNRKLVVMSNWIVPEEQFGQCKSMNPHLSGIHRMHHLIEVLTPSQDLTSAHNYLPDSIENQLDLPLQQTNRRWVSLRYWELSNTSNRQEVRENSFHEVGSIVRINAPG